MEYQADIDGYTVDLDTDMEGVGDDNPDRVSGCWVRYRGFSASLEALKAEGVLTTSDGGEHVVSMTAIANIEEWAYQNGY